MYELGKYSEIITISFDNDIVEFRESGSIGNSTYQIVETNVIDNKDKSVVGNFSLDYLEFVNRFKQNLKKDSIIQFNLKKDYPISIEFDLDDDMEEF